MLCHAHRKDHYIFAVRVIKDIAEDREPDKEVCHVLWNA